MKIKILLLILFLAARVQASDLENKFSTLLKSCEDKKTYTESLLALDSVAKTSAAKLDTKNLKDLLYNESIDGQVYTYLVPYVFSNEIPTTLGLKICWTSLKHHENALTKKDFASATQMMTRWVSCVNSDSGGVLPKIVQDVSDCYNQTQREPSSIKKKKH